MDRVIVYDGALPQTTDILYAGKFGLVGQAYNNRSMLGTSTVVAGLACTPASPTADLHVTVGVGTIYQMDPTDASAYGDLGVDNNSIMKQGILASPQVLTITPPATAGFSQVYLVQAALQDLDTGLTVLSYYNSANPASPFSGPANSGSSNYTTRTNPCVIALKAGVAATTGTQATPTADVGFVGLYAITVVNGATQITSGNIVQLPSAPFFPTLPSVPANVLNCAWNYIGADTGSANVYVISFTAGQPIPAAYVAGMTVKFKALTTNTGASTVNVNGLGAVAIRRATGVALSAADITSGQIVELSYDGTVFQMVNYLGAGATSNTTTTVSVPYVADSGAQNALVGTYSPAITSGQQVAGLVLSIKLANAITGACTINVNGLGVKSIKLGDLTDPPYNVFVAGEVLVLCYDGTQYQIINTSSGMFYRKPTANYTIYVNNAIGNDANDGVSNTSGHAMATIGAALIKAFGYAPSQYTITIQVAAGTYNESVSWPLNAGPAVTINGASTASVVVNGGSGWTFLVQGPNTAIIQNLTASNSGVNQIQASFAASNGATLQTFNTASGITWSGFYAALGATVLPGSHIFYNTCAAFYWGVFGGNVDIPNGVSHTVAAPITVTYATAFIQNGANLIINTTTPIVYVNPSFVSGTKFSVGGNGTISATGLGVGFLPGTAAGTTASGGQVSF